MVQDQAVKIAASDWIHDFAPRLGLGRFAVFEVPEPQLLTVGGQMADAIREGIESAKKAHQSLIRGEWDDVVDDLRGVWELTRNWQSDIKTALKADGYTEEAADSFIEVLKSHFALASKFHHKLDKSKQVAVPRIKPSKEDAYLVYATAMSVLNLISRKLNRGS
jgi:hypothetical protein